MSVAVLTLLPCETITSSTCGGLGIRMIPKGQIPDLPWVDLPVLVQVPPVAAKEPEAPPVSSSIPPTQTRSPVIRVRATIRTFKESCAPRSRRPLERGRQK